MKILKRMCLFVIITASVLVLASCYYARPQSLENGLDKPDVESGKSFPLVITDFEGRKVSIEDSTERIVSLAPGITEILFELGVGDRVVGVTDFDDFPEEVSKIPRVGDFQGPNMEAIAAQRPDIIFASTLSGKNSMEALQRLGIPVLVLEARNIDEIYSSIQILGEITGKAAEADALTAYMKERMAHIEERVSACPRQRVFYIVDLNGNFTAGRGTFIDHLITLGGGVNVAADSEGWVQYSMENLVLKNPEVIITAAHAGDMQSLGSLPGYRDTDAVKNNRVFVISDDNIISRTSYRIVQGLEEIARFLHPEAFKDLD